jgi:HPt (histidine-containing phosphotransfer) domain-containing protein
MMSPEHIPALHFDESGLMENTLRDSDLYNELIGMARESLQEYQQVLHKALADKDFQSLKSTAHSIKGLALTMHCPAMRMLALDVELSSDQHDLNLSKEKTNPLLEEINMLLEQYLFPKNK